MMGFAKAQLILRASAYRSPVPWQRWHFTSLSPFLTKPLPSQFLHLAFFLTFGPFSLAMMVSKVRFVRRIATEGCALARRRIKPTPSEIYTGQSEPRCPRKSAGPGEIFGSLG